MSRRRKIATAVGLGGLALATGVGPAPGSEQMEFFKNIVVAPKLGLIQHRDVVKAAVKADVFNGRNSVFVPLAENRPINAPENIRKLVREHPALDPSFPSTQFLVHMANVLEASPTSLEASLDPYGIAPGTHLATLCGEMPFPMFSTRGMTKRANPNATSDSKKNTSRSMYHHAIYLGNGWTYGFPEGVRNITSFMKGNAAYYEVVYPASSVDKKSVFRRVVRAVVETVTLGPESDSNFLSWKYSIFDKNCEHMATYMMTGKARSIQVARGKLALLGIGSATLLGLKTAARIARKVREKLMRKWGFKPGMRAADVQNKYDRQRRTYSFFNVIRGRAPKELNEARNAALATSKN